MTAVILAMLMLIIACKKGSNELVRDTNMTLCDCNFRYQCTVSGSGTTVWQGSAFSCDNTDDGTLQLRHSQFANGSLVKECNSADGRMIMARAVEVTDNSYTSQLTIPVTPEIDNKTVKCTHDNGTTIRVISASTVDITSISELYQPSIINVTNVKPQQLQFHWNPLPTTCGYVFYNIGTTGCCECPASTAETALNCTFESTALDNQRCMCSLHIVYNTCNIEYVTNTTPFEVILQVPGIPAVKVVPIYSQTRLQSVLISLHVNMEVNNYHDRINNIIDYTPISYNITIYDATTESITCDSVVWVSHQVQQSHYHEYNLSSMCSSVLKLSISAFATNVFGVGLRSEPITLDGANNLFHVSIANHNTNVIFCEVHDDVADFVCVIQAIYNGADTCTSCSSLNCTENNFVMNASDTQDISHLPKKSVFCFIAIATNRINASKVIQLGIFYTEAGISRTQPDVMNLIIISISVIVAGTTIVAFLLCISWLKLKRKETNYHTQTSTDIHRQDNPSNILEPVSIYSLLQPSRENDNVDEQQQCTYAEIGNNMNEGQRIQIPNHENVEYADVIHPTISYTLPGDANPSKYPKPLRCNLENLLIQLDPEVTPKWYELGLVIGISEEILDECSRHSPRECLVEVLDYWLRMGSESLTWRDVAETLKKIELEQFAANVLKAHEIGKREMEPDADKNAPFYLHQLKN